MQNRLPAARRKEQLLDVARHVFAERGFHLTSMNEVAEAAGVTKPVVYQHFRSKRALYLELLRSVGRHLTRRIEAAAKTANGPREQVEEGLRAYFGFVTDESDSYRLMFGGGTRRDAEFADEVAKAERAIAEVIADLIRIDGLGERDRLLFAHGIIGLAEGTTRQWLSGAVDLTTDEITALVADLAWRGLRGVRSDQVIGATA